MRSTACANVKTATHTPVAVFQSWLMSAIDAGSGMCYSRHAFKLLHAVAAAAAWRGRVYDVAHLALLFTNHGKGLTAKPRPAGAHSATIRANMKITLKN